MSKAKKTRQEKMIADLHRKLHQQQSITSVSTPEQKTQYTYTIKHTQAPMGVSTVTTITNLSLIKHDLIKTTIVTGAIISLQLLLFFLLKAHIIKIPMISY